MVLSTVSVIVDEQSLFKHLKNPNAKTYTWDEKKFVERLENSS